MSNDRLSMHCLPRFNMHEQFQRFVFICQHIHRATILKSACSGEYLRCRQKY